MAESSRPWSVAVMGGVMAVVEPQEVVQPRAVVDVGARRAAEELQEQYRRFDGQWICRCHSGRGHAHDLRGAAAVQEFQKVIRRNLLVDDARDKTRAQLRVGTDTIAMTTERATMG